MTALLPLADVVTLLCAAMDRAREARAREAVAKMLGDEPQEERDGD